MEENPQKQPRVPYARRLDEASLRAKVAVLVIGAGVLGALVGMLEADLGHHLWPLMLGMTLGAGSVTLIGQHWIATPFDRLADRLERLSKRGTEVLQRDLPVKRRDEVGAVARSVHHITATARQQNHEAQRLRRTMDHRVEDATRRATHSLRTLAMRDGLTKLGNRRFLDEQLVDMVQATRDSGDELTCVLMDLDNFKEVNDTLGHAVGDELLTLMGELIRGSMRETDIAARLGGDEFVVLMPGADPQRGRELADHIRQLFRQQDRAARPDGPHADVSAGVAGMNGERCDHGDALLARADHHLYEAKRCGKGRTHTGRRAA